MAESMDGAFGGDEVDNEADQVYNQICEEQGIGMADDFVGAGTGAVGSK